MVARPVCSEAVSTPAFQRTAQKLRFCPAAEFPATQYRETDLSFVHRLLAEEGLAFRYEHNQAAEAGDDASHARHQLIIFDRDAELSAGNQPLIHHHRNNATDATNTCRPGRKPGASSLVPSP
ncbi:MAG: hypothetical protein CVU34_18855 [Betaproteobacteria bacterium HGW-Betaproteobacteria-7]|jgi:uncharacterized protein involved in type VI secretion and phage assembly|nr:MAG: hypothetical protein CVU34_18855 [Betaproteobacteria bacterium HGW-Betaproteobacteria-7]